MTAARSLRLRENLLRRLTDSRRDGQDLRRRQFIDTLGSRIGNSTVRFLKPSCVRTAGTISRQPCSFSLIWTESQRVMPEILIRSLSDHCNSPGRLAEYKSQFQWVARQPGDDPSIFAIELETLARRAFMDIDLKIQLQMVRDRFIDGQADRALHRHLDSLEPNTLMIEMVDSCWIWERHCEPEIQPRTFSANK